MQTHTYTHTHKSTNLGLMVGSPQSASLISGIWFSKGYSDEFLEHKQHEKKKISHPRFKCVII